MKVRYASGKTTANGERKRGKDKLSSPKEIDLPPFGNKTTIKVYQDSRQATNHHQQSSESKKKNQKLIIEQSCCFLRCTENTRDTVLSSSSFHSL